MASWMVHLRVAEKVFGKMNRVGTDGAGSEKGLDGGCKNVAFKLEETEYVVGNIAPDSGIPSEDWTTFTPSTWVSHFSALDENGVKKVDIDRFIEEYLARDKMALYDERQKSFFLGYYNHLLTDMLWVDYVVNPSRLRDKENFETDRAGTMWKWKKDWYDLDFLYLQKHPNFHAFCVYENAIGFKNEFLDFFAEDAFDNRRQYITKFYLAGRENLDREYPWLSEAQMDAFVETATEKIVECNVKLFGVEGIK